MTHVMKYSSYNYECLETVTGILNFEKLPVQGSGEKELISYFWHCADRHVEQENK